MSFALETKEANQEKKQADVMILADVQGIVMDLLTWLTTLVFPSSILKRRVTYIQKMNPDQSKSWPHTMQNTLRAVSYQ